MCVCAVTKAFWFMGDSYRGLVPLREQARTRGQRTMEGVGMGIS